MKFGIQQKAKLLIATASGPISFTRSFEIFISAFDSAREKGCDRILFDCCGVTGELTTHERFLFGEEAARHEHSGSFHPRIALLGSPPTVDGFGVLVGRNRGMNARAFSVREEALKWLDD
jgi:hypothetical protein